MRFNYGISRVLLLTLCAVFVFGFVSSLSAYTGIKYGNYYYHTHDRLHVTTPDTCEYIYSTIGLPVEVTWVDDQLDSLYYYAGNGSQKVVFGSDLTYGGGDDHPCVDYFMYDADQDVYSYEFTFEFDEDVFNAMGVDSTAGLIVTNGWGRPTVNIYPGKIEVVGANPTPITLQDQMTEPFLYINLKVKSSASPYQDANLTLTECRFNEIPSISNQCYYDLTLSNPNGQTVYGYPIIGEHHDYTVFVDQGSPIWQDPRDVLNLNGVGELFVCDWKSVSGRVVFCGTSNPLGICSAQVTLTHLPVDPINDPKIPDQTITTLCGPGCGSIDCQGTYLFNQIMGGYDYKVTVKKHNAYRGAITANDAALVLRHLVENPALDGCCEYIAADVTGYNPLLGDCDISALDASMILQYVVQMIDYFPKNAKDSTNWLFVPTEWMYDLDGEGEDICICPEEAYWYYPLNANYMDQDFAGILLGDVSRDWPYQKVAPTELADDVINTEFRNVSSDLIEVVMNVDLGQGARSFQMDVEFDASAYEVVEISAGQDMNDWLFASNIVGNTIKIATANGHNTYGNLESVVIGLRPLNGSADAELILTDLVIDDMIYLTEPRRLGGAGSLPTDYALHNNYPNPFNPETVISFSLPEAEHVQIEIINLLGQSIRSLTDRSFDAGTHTVVWDATNNSGDEVASGVYFYKIQAGNFVDTKKMTLMR